MAAKIKKGDMVEVIAGKDKGATGQVLEVFPSESRVIVEGVNIQKRHIKAQARPSMPEGGIIDRPGKIHVSNVRFYSSKLEKGVRVGFQLNSNGSKVRVARGRNNNETALD
ncbi:MAG: 50S ribosomal protein L24 [Myxococcota bacterium]